MSKSVRRVETAARQAGLNISIVRMPDSTRTAAEAAAACGCAIGQIVKSLVFQGERTGALKLLLVSGDHAVDLAQAADRIGEGLTRADPRHVREQTGFAIGGVSPIGHLSPIETWIDEHLLSFETVWAAAGAPDAVFEIAPEILERAAGAKRFKAV